MIKALEAAQRDQDWAAVQKATSDLVAVNASLSALVTKGPSTVAPAFLPDDYVFARIQSVRLPPWPAKVVNPKGGANVTIEYVRPPNAPSYVPTEPVVVPGRNLRAFDLISDTPAEQIAETAKEMLASDKHTPANIAELRISATESFTDALALAAAATHVQVNPDRVAEMAAMRPIGVVSSPYRAHISAPRQPNHTTSSDEASIMLRSDIPAAALHNLAGFDFAWVIYWFCYSRNWNAQLIPPRDPEGGPRGVFATRAPHRPNPIGLSLVRVLSVEGRRVRICGHDILHGTPVLDIKPYLPYTDAVPSAKAGWVDEVDRRVREGKAAPLDHKPDVIRTRATAAAAAAIDEADGVAAPAEVQAAADADGATRTAAEKRARSVVGHDLATYYGRKSKATVRLLSTVVLNSCGKNLTRAEDDSKNEGGADGEAEGDGVADDSKMQ